MYDMRMLNRIDTAVVRESVSVRAYETVIATGSRQRHGTVYHPVYGHIIGYNFGSRVRPDVAPIRVTSAGDETVESFLARGGRITVGASKIAKGASLVDTIKSGTTRIATSRG